MNFAISSRDIKCRSWAPLAFLAALVCIHAWPARGEIKEQIVAVVNDEIITYSELERILSPIFEQYEKIYSGAELFSMLQKARRDVLEHLIQERLILQLAKEQNIREMAKGELASEVDRLVAEGKKRFPSEEDFNKELKREGLTMEQFREHQEKRALIRAMLIKEVSSRCAVSPAEVREYYESHRSEFTEKEKIHVSQIWIKEVPGKLGEAERRARDILECLDDGEDFADLARKHSQCPYADRGGDWGFISRGHWNKELEDAAFALAPGEYSGVVRTPLGCHIIMLHEKKPPVTKPLTEVYAEIENKIFTEKATAKRDEWIERLKKKAYISVVK